MTTSVHDQYGLPQMCKTDDWAILPTYACRIDDTVAAFEMRYSESVNCRSQVAKSSLQLFFSCQLRNKQTMKGLINKMYDLYFRNHKRTYEISDVSNWSSLHVIYWTTSVHDQIGPWPYRFMIRSIHDQIGPYMATSVRDHFGPWPLHYQLFGPKWSWTEVVIHQLYGGVLQHYIKHRYPHVRQALNALSRPNTHVPVTLLFAQRALESGVPIIGHRSGNRCF